MNPRIPRIPVYQPQAKIPVGYFHCPHCKRRHRVDLAAVGKLPAGVRYRCNHRMRAVVLVEGK